MSIVRAEGVQATSQEPVVTARPDAVVADPLTAALAEVAKLEVELRSTGDAAMLARFGNAESGAALAEMLGYEHLSAEEAHTVDQLIWMPDGMKLVRAFLRTTRPDPV
jgi:hypothetical protein